jgi:drug/metabolite transporter (DMT)-like permease
MRSPVLVPMLLGLVAFCVTAETMQQVSFKLGVGAAGRSGNFLRGVALQPLIWVGIALWVVESIGWVLVLQRAPLTIAYPMMTLTYAAVPVAAFSLLRERISPRQILGAALIFGGVVCVALSGL